MYKPVEVILDMEQLEDRLRYWQARLRLQDWLVEVKIERGYVMGDMIGKIQPFTHNKRAIVSLLESRDYDPTDILPYDMERILVHELLHLHFWPLTEDEGESAAEEQAINAIAEALVSLERSIQDCEDFYEDELRRRPYGFLPSGARIVDIRTSDEVDGA